MIENAHMLHALDLLPDFVIILDATGTIAFCNRQTTALFSEAILGQPMMGLLADDVYSRQTFEMMQAQLHKQGYWEGDIGFRLPNGTASWFFIRAKTINADQTLLISTRLVDHEIVHHGLQAVFDLWQRDFNNALEAVGDMLCAYNPDNNTIGFISPSCYNLTGYTYDEFLDNPILFLEIITPEFRPLIQKALHEAEIGQSFKLEYTIRRNDNDVRWVLNSVTPAEDADGGTRLVCALTDTTAYRELNELKSLMIRMATHDLNNPLATAIGFFDLMVEDMELDEREQSMVATIQRAHQRMIDMLRELLSFAEIQPLESFGLHQPIEVGDLIHYIMEEFRAQAQQQKHTLAYTPPVEALWVGADRVQLHHAIGNYISNALKYTPSPGQIEVSAYGNNKRAYIEVLDNGYGVAEKKRSQLFTMGFREKRPGTEQVPGTGWGLHLVKRVVNKYGGEVYYRPRPEGGSIFGLWLPILEHDAE